MQPMQQTRFFVLLTSIIEIIYGQCELKTVFNSEILYSVSLAVRSVGLK